MATRRDRAPGFPWRQVAAYGVLLAIGTAALQWLDYQRLARTAPGEIYIALVAAGFLALGVAVGLRLVRPSSPAFDGNPQALASLGISPRELEVLQSLARGLSNKEIARALGVSPNTVKTHVARLFEKLDASNRAHAIARARDFGILP
jgi:DNA-binding CsgD family transcriptional regulator